MRVIPVLFASAALGAGAVGAAVKLSPDAMTVTSEQAWKHERPGPDSARVAMLLDALGRTDPLVCDLLGDQIGNFWSSGERGGVGRLAASPPTLRAAKDSIGGTITDARAIKRLVAELDAPNACTRRVASKLLGRSTIPVAQLSALLSDASPNVRESAAMAAGNGEHHDLAPALIKALDDRVPAVGAMAAWALGETEDRTAVPALIKALRGGEPRVRLAAIWALGQMEDARATPDVLTTLRDADPVTRAMSADVLGRLESKEAIGQLEQALGSDPDWRVREAAARALGHISIRSSATALGKALGDADVRVRRAAAEAIGDLDDLEVAPDGLVAALSSSDAELRHRAARALCSIGDPTTTSALVGLLSSTDSDLRKDVVEGLGKIGTPEAVRGMTKALNDKDPQVRRAAAEALGEAKDH
jgi:HEAT repeat protein